jgi:hypothetical protein
LTRERKRTITRPLFAVSVECVEKRKNEEKTREPEEMAGT